MSKVFLGDIAKERRETCKGSKNEYPIVGLEHLTPEEITLSAWEEGKDNTFTKLFYKGDILFGRRRAYLKKAAIAPFDGICSGDITVIQAMPEKILPELLPFIIQNDVLFDFAVGKSAGSLSPRVKWEHLKNYEFELPGLDKQLELAKVLWAMDATKKSYQNLLLKTDELVKAQFIEMFGDPESNTMGWDVKKLGEIFDIGSSKRVFQSEWKYEGVPFYRAREIVKLSQDGYVDNELFISEEMFAEYSEKYGIPQAGDIMVTGVGTLGICYLVKSGDRFYFKDGNIIWLKKKSEVSSEYVYYSFKLPYVRKQIQNGSTGTTVGTYTIVNAKNTRMLFPPLELQNQFADFVIQTDKSKAELEQALTELTATYKKIISENLG